MPPSRTKNSLGSSWRGTPRKKNASPTTRLQISSRRRKERRRIAQTDVSSWLWRSKIVFGQQSVSSDSLWHLNLRKSPTAPLWSVHRRSHLPFMGISVVTASWGRGENSNHAQLTGCTLSFCHLPYGIPEDPRSRPPPANDTHYYLLPPTTF